MDLKIEQVEAEMIKLIEQVRDIMGIRSGINTNTCPNDIGISSQILISVTTRLEGTLKVAIPENCYLFYDKNLNKQLTIKEASQKLVNVIK